MLYYVKIQSVNVLVFVFMNLPIEIWRQISAGLHINDYTKLRRTSKYLNSLSRKQTSNFKAYKQSLTTLPQYKIVKINADNLLELDVDCLNDDSFKFVLGIQGNDKECVRLLRSRRGGKISNLVKFQAFMECVAERHGPELAECLLSKNSDMDWSGYYLKGQCAVDAVNWASRTGNVNALELLVFRGADIHGCDGLGRTAIHFAAFNRSIACLSFLIKNGAVINSKLKDGRTALHLAASTGNIECLKMLISAGANIQAFDEDNQLPLDYAIQFGHSCSYPLLNTWF